MKELNFIKLKLKQSGDNYVGNFIKDLEEGHIGEETVLMLLSEAPELVAGMLNVNQPEGRFEKYDIEIRTTIEVKTEKVKSDNMYFELGNPKTEKLTGIMASAADYIIYLNPTLFIIFNREILLEDLTEVQEVPKASRKLDRCGDGNSQGILVKKEYIIDNFKSVYSYKYLT